MLVLSLSAAGLDASSTVRVCVFGVVTHTSFAEATYATPSVGEGSLTHLPGLRVPRSTGHTSLVARLPTYANPSPIETALGPTMCFLPLYSRSAVLKPSTRVKLP